MASACSVTLGVDTHKDLHVAVALDQVGRRLGVATFGTDDAHHPGLWAWASDFGSITQAGVEGTGSFGYRLAQFLTGSGVQVFEVNRPNRITRRRRGKSDPVDAEAAARAVLAGDATATPKNRSGPAGQLRALLVARRSATKARTQTEQQLRSLILELDDDQRAGIDRRRILELTSACAALAGTDGTSIALGALARRWQHLDQEIGDNDQDVTTIVRRVVPGLLARPGIGPVCAASCWSPPAITLIGSTARPRSPPYAASARSSTPAVGPNATASTAAVTAPPTAPCGSSPITGSCTTHRPAPTPPAAPPPGPAARRSFGCSSATSPVRSSPRSATPSARLTPFPPTP
jgi:transposase